MGMGLVLLGLFLWLLNKLMLYCLYTLVDITATGQHHGGEKLARNQQQNFDTVTQTIQLSGNMYYANTPIKIPAAIFRKPDIDCWYFEWTMEIEDLFLKDNDPIAGLKRSFEFVPFISGLTEQAVFDKPLFKLGQNIVFDFKQ
jgi:hypothetical protein